MSKKDTKNEAEKNDKVYTAIIKDSTIEHSLPDNEDYIDVRFNILLNKKVVAERRLGFPMGTTEEAIMAEVKANCEMYKNDHALAEEVEKRSELKAETESVLSGLKGKEV